MHVVEGLYYLITYVCVFILQLFDDDRGVNLGLVEEILSQALSQRPQARNGLRHTYHVAVFDYNLLDSV